MLYDNADIYNLDFHTLVKKTTYHFIRTFNTASAKPFSNPREKK